MSAKLLALLFLTVSCLLSRRRFLVVARGMLIASGLVGPPHVAIAETVRPSEIYVIDGDTILFQRSRVRLLGFDTPETYQPRCEYELAIGLKATSALESLLRSPHRVDLTIQPGLDRYGRHLGRLFFDGVDVGTILINNGLARGYSGGRRQSWC